MKWANELVSMKMERVDAVDVVDVGLDIALCSTRRMMDPFFSTPHVAVALIRRVDHLLIQ